MLAWLSSIVSVALREYVRRWRELGVAVVLCTVFLGALQVFAVTKMEPGLTAIRAIDPEGLIVKISQEKMVTSEELEHFIQTFEQDPTIQKTVVILLYEVGPWLLLLLCGAIALAFLAQAFLLLLAVSHRASAYDVLLRLPASLLPLAIILSFSMFLSLGYIPIIGGAFFMLLSPFFLAAPVLFVARGGILQSIRSSFMLGRKNYTRLLFGMVLGLLLSMSFLIVVGVSLQMVATGVDVIADLVGTSAAIRIAGRVASLTPSVSILLVLAFFTFYKVQLVLSAMKRS